MSVFFCSPDFSELEALEIELDYEELTEEELILFATFSPLLSSPGLEGMTSACQATTPSTKGTAKVCQATGEPKGTLRCARSRQNQARGSLAKLPAWSWESRSPSLAQWIGLCQGNRQYNDFSKHWRNYHHPQVLLHWCPIPACGYMTVESGPLKRHISTSHEAQAQKNNKYQAPGSATPHSDPFSGLQNCSMPTKLPDNALSPDGRQAVWDGEKVKVERKKPTCPELEAAIDGGLPDTED